MIVDYVEKAYESYFNKELANRSKVFYPLGQVQEGVLGFDSSAFSKDRKLWRKLNYQYLFFLHFRGVELTDIATEMENYLNIEIRNISTIKVNLLFQYKRPEYIISAHGKEWIYWRQPYFRYNIYKKQQDLLMHIHTTFSSKVLVLYASPTIKGLDELVDTYLRNRIIECSNFKKAVELNEHNRNSFIQAGTYSIALSESEKIENFDLLSILKTLSDKGNTKENQKNKDIVVDFCNKIKYLVYKCPYLSKSFKKLNENISRIEKYELVYNFLVMENFRQLTGIQWLIKI